MSLKVVGAGLGRTGTHSLKLALEELLGAPCYHMAEVFPHPEHVPVWKSATIGEEVDWDALFVGYAAAVDWPASAFWKELAAHYPEAVIVYSRRDPEAWWTSASATIFSGIEHNMDPAWKDMVMTLLDRRFTSDLGDKEACIGQFLRHENEVLASAPRDRLLIWEPADGWEPLSKALGVPVPDKPFPKSNTTEEFQARVAQMRAANAPGLDFKQ